jgi:hypothetical protein
MAAALTLAAAATILIGIVPQRLWDAVAQAVASLFS